jgi:beta-mannosidase
MTLVDRGFVCATPAGAVGDPSGLGGVRWIECRLPNTAAGALRDAGLWGWESKRAFDDEDWWWRAPVEVKAGETLVLGGIATLWDAWLDGVHVASGDNMFRSTRVAIVEDARELVIRCRSLTAELAKKRPRPRWRVPMLEQQQLRWFRTTLLGRTPGWSPPCAPVGPWREIQLGSVRLGSESISTRVVDRDGIVEVDIELPDFVTGASLVVHEQAVALELHDRRWRGRMTIANPAKWSPHTHGEPTHMNCRIETQPRDFTLNRQVAFRTIEFDDDLSIRVNGVPIFCRGACWTPLDVVSLRAPNGYRDAVTQMRAAGINMVRVGGTMMYEHRDFYSLLDAAGILLWQDFMFANMDYPADDAAFTANVIAEVDEQLDRLRQHACFAIACGNSEGSQQAAMAGAPRERWDQQLFTETIASRVREKCPDVHYIPSSTHGGAFPHASNRGPSSYYGVGAYLRPFEDARRAEIAFASECLAFANVPFTPPSHKVHDPAWKQRAPRDLGAGWDFDDVRDHYTALLYNVDPIALRSTDHDRYLYLAQATSGEVMTRAFAEWRRARSPTHGALIWFLRDLWPGAGWGIVDATGAPKPCWFALRRALAPRALAITDEGTNGLALHVVNDRPDDFTAQLELTLWRGGDVEVGRGARDVVVPPHGAIELAAADLFDGWHDLSYAYRFGPPVCDVLHARCGELDAFWFPAGLPSTRERDVGLTATARAGSVELRAARFAQTVAIAGVDVDDNYFHLAPNQTRTVAITRGTRGTVTALNSERTVRFEVPAK